MMEERFPFESWHTGYRTQRRPVGDNKRAQLMVSLTGDHGIAR